MAPRLSCILALVALGACYETPKPACQFLCGEGDACPTGYECSIEDNRCHLVLAGGNLAECTDDIPDPIDANTPPIDALADAADIDAIVDAFVCATALNPTSDGSAAGLQDLVLSEINPGQYIEVYNNTAAAIDLDTVAYQLYSNPDSVAIAAANVGMNITVPAHGFAELGWPAAFTDTDAGGEVILFVDNQFTDMASIMDFVCWGTNPHSSSKQLAEDANKWDDAAACASALTMGAIHRLATTDGVSAADYDVTAPPSPMTCAPL
jgi:hypothetical protein